MPYFYTNEADARERLDYWAELISRSIVPLEVQPFQASGDGTFDGGIEASKLADMDVVTVTAGRHRVRRARQQLAARDEQLYCVCLLVSGSARVQRGDRRDVVEAGDILLLDSSDRYELSFSGDHQIACVHLPQGAIPIPREDVDTLAARRLAAQQGTAALMWPFLHQLIRQVHSGAVAMPERTAATVRDMVETFLLERLGEERRQSQTPRRLVMLRVRQDIEHSLGSPELSPEQLAAKHHVSVDSLNAMFMAEGVSLDSWIQARRLERCRRDLRDPEFADAPLSVVGDRWGMPDVGAFEQAFTMRFGVSPHEFRLQQRLERQLG